ncbi:hypothetical protein [Crocosphaera sp. Alani8]|uniref:hypothetical protein n=1 Tax=Crocosphaera sp. Alani8 TaxID=3038952 RepID=UPI00313BBFE2
MVLLSWPILLLLLRKEPLNWLDGWLLWILLLLFSRTYETSIIPTVIFSAISVVKLYKARQSKKQVIIYSISLFVSLAALSIGLYFIIDPRSASNKSGFSSSILNLRVYKGALVSASFVFLSTIGLICRKNSFILVSLFPMTLYAYIILFSERGLTAINSFSSRTLSLTLLPFLLICTVVACYCNIKSNKISTRIFVLFVLIMVIGNLRFASDWNNFRQQFIGMVTTKKGYIPIEETIIKHSPDRWLWNNSNLGIVWSYRCVRAIVLNNPRIKWEPFNPRQELILKNYVSYDPFFSHVDNDIKICK